MKRKDESASFGVIGLGRFGLALVESLSSAEREVIAIDRDESRVREARKFTDLAMVVAIIGAVAVIVVYFVDSSLFESLLPNALGILSATAVLDPFAFDFVFNWPGLVFYLSVAALFVFLTAQTVQKRRWN